ncbi:MAG: helix-turn-helix transcriptional regulator [Acidaminococcaceae bacterium]|nr:helix-turn-helix transcriptional regulator [Acidaminococcaceae bacterium]
MNKDNIKSLIVKQENRNPNSKDSIAFRLNYIIKKRQYTAKEVAALTEDKSRGLKPISPATISLYINGKSAPNISYIRRLAKVLNVDPSWLACDLPYEWINRPQQSPDLTELIEIYGRLSPKKQKLIMETARIAIAAMQNTTDKY